MILVVDTNWIVRNSAYEAVKRIGEKAATNESIALLLDAYKRNDLADCHEVREHIGKILYLLLCLSDLKDLKDDTVQELSKYIDVSYWEDLRNISPEKFMSAFLKTKIVWWLPIIRSVFVRCMHGITVTGSTVVVHSSKELVELSLPNREFGNQLQAYFDNWLNKSLERCERFA
jgi:hypothetical protein